MAKSEAKSQAPAATTEVIQVAPGEFMLKMVQNVRDTETARRRALKVGEKVTKKGVDLHIPADRIVAWVHPVMDRASNGKNIAENYSAAVAKGYIVGVSMVPHSEKPGQTVPSHAYWTVFAAMAAKGMIAYNPRSGRVALPQDAGEKQDKAKTVVGLEDILMGRTSTPAALEANKTAPQSAAGAAVGDLTL